MEVFTSVSTFLHPYEFGFSGSDRAIDSLQTEIITLKA